MRKATHVTAVGLGLSAAVAGFEHGLFEVLQGNVPTKPGFIVSFGHPCIPEDVWNACEPAFTVLPNMPVTGILAMLLSVLMLVWLFAGLKHRLGGWVMIALSILLLLFGGGLFPPVIAFVAGIAAFGINRPFKREHNEDYTKALRIIGRYAPWTIGLFVLQVFGQWIVGYVANDFMMRIMGINVIIILALIPLTVWTAYGKDYSYRTL